MRFRSLAPSLSANTYGGGRHRVGRYRASTIVVSRIMVAIRSTLRWRFGLSTTTVKCSSNRGSSAVAALLRFGEHNCVIGAKVPIVGAISEDGRAEKKKKALFTNEANLSEKKTASKRDLVARIYAFE